MTSHTTADFEPLLDRRNVVAVNYDPDRDHLDVWVSQKLAPAALAPEDLVANNLPDDYDGDHDVHDAGMDDERDGFDPAITDRVAPSKQLLPEATSDRRERHRPVVSGVSEIAEGGTAATCGVLARVTDPDAAPAEYHDDVTADDFVRVSNHHVYLSTHNEMSQLGRRRVRQPAQLDGGNPEDVVGTTVGAMPLGEGNVDAAVRSVTIARESPAHYDLPDGLGTGVRRGDYKALVDATLVKGGRTTGVTRAPLNAHDAAVRVNYGGDTGTVTFRHQLLAGDMSDGGDSGSPVFHEESGDLVGHLYAGSDSVTVINRAADIEAALGLELMPEDTNTVDADVQVEMESPDLSFEGCSVLNGPVAPGESVELRVTVASNYPSEDVWLEAFGPNGTSRQVTDPPEDYVVGEPFDIDIEVSAPLHYEEAFTVTLDGGHVLRDE